MIYDTYLQDQDILDFGAEFYPEIRFGYSQISKDDYTDYLDMVDKLRVIYNSVKG